MFKYSKSRHLNFAKIYKKAEKIYHNLPPIKKRRKHNLVLKIIKYLSYFVVVLFSLFLVFLLVNFFDLKHAYQKALNGKANAEYAIGLLQEKEYIESGSFAELAEADFKESKEIIEELSDQFVINNIVFFKNQLDELYKLMTTGEILCRAITQGSGLGKNFSILTGSDSLTFTKISKEQKRQVLKHLYESSPEINGIKANIDLALINLENIEHVGIMRILKNKIFLLKDQLHKVNKFLAQSLPAAELFSAILGYPEKSSFLVMLQNNDELRPTGGFLGTYGILEFEDGEILRFDTHDIYHMDMPVKDKMDIKPPAPLIKYLGIDKWYLRDANWSPDWPESAKKIEWFYQEENKRLSGKDQINNFDGEFGGVIAITPDFITSILALIGPIFIEDTEYNHNNFTQLLEYRVEQEYVELGVPSWQRKEVIGEISKEIKARIFDLQADKLYTMYNLILDNLDRKNIILYFDDFHLENIVAEQNWGGEIKQKNCDYLMVVDSNMASYKTDAVISKNINYKIDQGANGTYARVNINYLHNGKFDWRTTRYRTYTRVYTPLGSELVQVKGISGKINKWDDSSVKTAEELGKTVISSFIEIEPGEIGSLEFYYKLPDNIDEIIKSNKYELYIQRQPGSKFESLNVNLFFNKPIVSYNPTGFNVNSEKNNIIWDTNLVYDKEFLVNFK